jgi:alpha-glucosidase
MKNVTQQADWWRGATIYQIYPRSFMDSNGDGVGDLAGITARLDYVATLGVDAIWLSPFFTSPMADFGYDVSDYVDVDPVFGAVSDFDALVENAHALGLKVIIDQVYAHTSDQHKWFAESRADRTNAKADWYVWADPKADGSPPNNWASVFGGPSWTWDARRGQYYMHNFLKEQPQLNVHNWEVQDALLDVARFWLDRGVDGFRLDAINFAMHNRALTDNPVAPPSDKPRTRAADFQLYVHNQGQPEIPDFLARVRALTDQYDARFTLAEIGGANMEDVMKAYTAGEDHLNSAYSFSFLASDTLTPELVRDSLLPWIDEGWPSWAFSNHDARRWLSRWAPEDHEDAFARMVMMLFICLPGNITLWQGEELGLTQVDIPFEQLRDPEAIANWPLIQSRDGARTPMVWEKDAPHCGFSSVETWLPIGPDHAAKSVNVQNNDPASLLNWTRQLISLRQSTPALRTGRIERLEVNGQILQFDRVTDDTRIRCFFNFGTKLERIDTADHDHTLRANFEETQKGYLPAMGAALKLITP